MAVPLGVALAVGALVAHLVPPLWRAGGLPYLLGYGKNVEHAAVGAALLAAAVSSWLLGAKKASRPLALVGILGFGVLAVSADLRGLLAAGPQLVLALLLAAALRAGATSDGLSPDHEVQAAPGLDPTRRDLPLFSTSAVLVALTVLAFVLSLRPLDIDVYHHGEVLASALDLLRGGRPFETFLWPHGLHDTGLTALFVRATSKVGTSPIALAQATCRALGVLTAFALAVRLTGSRVLALAASTGLVLAMVLRGSDAPGPAAALHQLGVLVFVVLGFVVFRGPRSQFGAGALFGLAYLFRVETAVYAGVAALGVVATAASLPPAASRGEALRSTGKSLARLGAGAAAVLLAFRLRLGWPGPAWFTFTLRDLPRYHGDASGLPFPWPLRDWEGDPGPAVGMGLGALFVAALLLVEAGRRRNHGPLWFLALFAALSTRSTLGRSDEAHLLQWTALPVLGLVLLGVDGLRRRFSWPRARSAGLLVSSLVLLDIARLTLTLPNVLALAAPSGPSTSGWALLLEHVRPNPPVGRCQDASFTPTEAHRELNRRFIEATCEVEELLRERGVKALVVQHSAPWYQVRFDLPLLTRFFALARAYTPKEQRELVADLRAHRPQAILRARGFAALERFETPDAVRVPLVDAYLKERQGGVAAETTPLGDFYFWDEPLTAPSPPPLLTGAEPPAVGIGVERVVYAPESGLFFAEGWAADVSVPAPLQALRPPALRNGPGDGWSRLDYGRPRPDLAPECGPPGASACGFEFSAYLGPETFVAWQTRGVVDIVGVTADGRSHPLELPLERLRILGPLRGRAWGDLRLSVAEAAARGAADRRDALAARLPRTTGGMH